MAERQNPGKRLGGVPHIDKHIQRSSNRSPELRYWVGNTPCKNIFTARVKVCLEQGIPFSDIPGKKSAYVPGSGYGKTVSNRQPDGIIPTSSFDVKTLDETFHRFVVAGQNGSVEEDEQPLVKPLWQPIFDVSDLDETSRAALVSDVFKVAAKFGICPSGSTTFREI